MITTTDFAKYLSRFLAEYLPHERNVSPNTILAYRDTFVQFIDFMKSERKMALERLFLKDVSKDNVIGFMNWLATKQHSSPSTRNSRLAAIRSFCSYLQYEVIDMMEQWQSILSIKCIRTETKVLNYLTVEGVKLLLAQPDTTTWRGRRHLAILSLMYDTGARVQELADLKVDSVRINSEPYTIRLFGKGPRHASYP